MPFMPNLPQKRISKQILLTLFLSMNWTNSFKN